MISRELHQQGIHLPINVPPSLSRLMGFVLVAKQQEKTTNLYLIKCMQHMLKERELRGLVAIVGEDALNERDKQLLDFAGVFEDQFLRQGRDEDRSIDETLTLCWNLMNDID